MALEAFRRGVDAQSVGVPASSSSMTDEHGRMLMDTNADFGRSFWRSAPKAMTLLPPLTARAIDDETFRLMAENVPTLCWVANGDGYIVWYNRRWHEYCGTTPEEMEGWGWRRCTTPICCRASSSAGPPPSRLASPSK
jgi:PAS domain-containing protein